MTPDAGTMLVDGREMTFRSTQEAREAGIETVYQTLAVAPALDIASNLFLAREQRRPGLLGSVLRMLDTGGMKREAKQYIDDLGISTLQNINQAVETLPGASGRRSPWLGRPPSAEGGDLGRADGRARRPGDRSGAQADPGSARAGPGHHLDQPQHA